MRTVALVVLYLFAINMASKPKKSTALADYQSQYRPSQAKAASPSYNDSSPHQNSTQNSSPHWYTSPEWWLAILGFSTLFVIIWQVYVAGVAAEAAKEGADAVINS